MVRIKTNIEITLITEKKREIPIYNTDDDELAETVYGVLNDLAERNMLYIPNEKTKRKEKVTSIEMYENEE